MSYYGLFGLQREPFSTSPDPGFLFLSREHKAALYRLRIAVSLKRGLSVVMGDVGTGKTTLSRKLAQQLRDEPKVSLYMMLNPYFRTQKQFLSRLAGLFRAPIASARPSALDLIEGVERFLFRRGVQEKETVVLLLDEAQILPDYVLEVLRILLNYETNEYKILQLILVGQMELLPRVSRMSNFWDRISLKFVLHPLGLEETRELIEFRLARAGYERPGPLFSDQAVKLIHAHSGGYPRRITTLCHNCLEGLVMTGRELVDEEIVRRQISQEVMPADVMEVAANVH